MFQYYISILYMCERLILFFCANLVWRIPTKLFLLFRHFKKECTFELFYFFIRFCEWAVCNGSVKASSLIRFVIWVNQIILNWIGRILFSMDFSATLWTWTGNSIPEVPLKMPKGIKLCEDLSRIARYVQAAKPCNMSSFPSPPICLIMWNGVHKAV